jgi:hypothetical protein
MDVVWLTAHRHVNCFTYRRAQSLAYIQLLTRSFQYFSSGSTGSFFQADFTPHLDMLFCHGFPYTKLADINRIN